MEKLDLHKMVKLCDDHYIVVDDSEIKKEGVICYSFYTKEVTMFGLPHTILCKRITHSFGKRIREVDNRHISEVEEAIYGYSVEKIASDLYKVSPQKKAHFIKGFKAHQELVKDKLFTVADMINAFVAGTNSGANYESLVDHDSDNNEEAKEFSQNELEEFEKSLLPKTEWDVIFDEHSKIRLA